MLCWQKIFFALKFIANCESMHNWRFIKAKRLSSFSFQTKWNCNVRSLNTFTFNKSGMWENCGYINKALSQRWKKNFKCVTELTVFSPTFTKTL